MKVLVICPCYGMTMLAPTHESILGASLDLAAHGLLHSSTTYSRTGIEESRCLLTTVWMDTTDATHLLMVDSDMGFPTWLPRAMLKLDQPVVGSIYASRNQGYPQIGQLLGNQADNHFSPAHHVGGGILLLRRDVVHTLLTEDPTLVDPTPVPPLGVSRILRVFRRMEPWASEDLSFCARCRAAEVPIWAYDGSGVTHWGLEPHRV